MLNLQGRGVVVVGAGAVGLRKARSLQDAGADVKLIDEHLDPKNVPPGIHTICQPYSAELLKGALLVFACTDDEELNGQIAADARLCGAIVNVVDRPDDCDFLSPAVVRKGDVIVAVGTNGAAPGLAARLKDHLAAALPDRIDEFAAALRRIRRQLQQKLPDATRRGRILKRLSEPQAYEAFRRGGDAALRESLEEILRDN